MSQALSARERQELHQCEQTIRAGLNTFWEVGKALAAIRDSRLYRQEFGDFESYCRDRWGMGRAYAHRLIEGAKVVPTLTIGNTPPANEAQVRPLVGLDPETQRDLWRQAQEEAKADGRPVSGTRVEELKRRILAARPAIDPKVAAVAREEQVVLRHAARDARSGRIGQAERLLERFRKLIEGLGGEANEGLHLTGQIQRWLDRLRE